MDRPTTKEVEYALEWFSQSIGGPGGVLAAEVKALRSELVDYKDAVKTWAANVRDRVAERDAARATIARVEALLPKWDAKGFVNLVDQMATTECINELEAALKGKGP